MKFLKNPFFIGISFFGLFTLLAFLKFIPLFRDSHIKTTFLTDHEGGKELWMTVFVHGTFHAGLTFLSYNSVSKDKLSASRYQYIMRKIRRDPIFYQNQPILDLGLIQVTPSLTLSDTTTTPFSAYPIIQTYAEILEQVAPGKEKNQFYTFGWPGLISKASRQRQALYLYNALCRELERYKTKGIKPHIRLITFSHGGNVALGMGAIHTILTNVKTERFASQDCKESIASMEKILSNVKKRKDTTNPYAHTPITNDLCIDELVLLAVPIQPETDFFCHCSLFKKIYSFYSDEDGIQSVDWVSSKQPYAAQRINTVLTHQKYLTQNKPGIIIQARIMIDRNLAEQTVTTSKITEERKTYESVENAPWWKRLLYRGNLIQKKSADPTHREFWFTYWDRQGALAFLNPFPVAVLTPFLIATLQKLPQIIDADLNLVYKPESMLCQLTKHNNSEILRQNNIPPLILNRAQKKMNDWRPASTLKPRQFEIAKKYLQEFDEKITTSSFNT